MIMAVDDGQWMVMMILLHSVLVNNASYTTSMEFEKNVTEFYWTEHMRSGRGGIWKSHPKNTE